MAETLRLDGELGSRLVSRLPHVVVAILIVLIGVRAALLLAGFAGTPADENLGPVAPVSSVRNVVDVPSILRAGLFGQSPAATGSNAPATSMPLVLAGVVAAQDEKLGLAMIGTATNNIEMKKVGDTLPGGAKLHAVHVDRVLIDRGGSIEALALPEFVGISFSAPPPLVNNTSQSIERVEQAIRNNPNVIGQVMHRTPVFSDGRLRGMRVSPGPNAAAFTRLGLRNNDLVTAINGVELNDEARSRDVFDSLSASAEARVTVERGGITQELVLNLSDIAGEAETLAAAPVVEPPVDPGVAPGPPQGVPPPAPDAESAR